MSVTPANELTGFELLNVHGLFAAGKQPKRRHASSVADVLLSKQTEKWKLDYEAQSAAPHPTV